MLSSIEEQGKLTEDLKAQIQEAPDPGGGGRSVPPVPSEKKNEGDNRKRKRTGAACGASPFTEVERAGD